MTQEGVSTAANLLQFGSSQPAMKAGRLTKPDSHPETQSEVELMLNPANYEG